MTPKQRKFVDEYLIDLNATQAAIRAGYSPHTAEQQGHQLLEKTLVSAAVKKAMAERSRRTGIAADRIINELARIAFSNAADVINPLDGSILPEAERDDTAAVQSVRTKTTPTKNGSAREHEVKLYDKLRALELLMRHLGMYETKEEREARLNFELTGALLAAFAEEETESEPK